MPRKGEALSPEVLAKILESRQRHHGPFLTEDQKREGKRRQDQTYYIANRNRLIQASHDYYHAHLETGRAKRREYERSHSDQRKERYLRWVAANPAQSLEIRREWARRHPEQRVAAFHRRRARLLGQFVEDVDRREVYRRGAGLCGICGDPIDTARFDVDHIIPLVAGGEHSYANTQPAHPSCNYRKPKKPKEAA